MFKLGDHVWADFGAGKVLAHVVGTAHVVSGETKWGVQDSAGSVHDLAHREPQDRDAGGSGLTFWSL